MRIMLKIWIKRNPNFDIINLLIHAIDEGGNHLSKMIFTINFYIPMVKSGIKIVETRFGSSHSLQKEIDRERERRERERVKEDWGSFFSDLSKL